MEPKYIAFTQHKIRQALKYYNTTQKESNKQLQTTESLRKKCIPRGISFRKVLVFRKMNKI